MPVGPTLEHEGLSSATMKIVGPPVEMETAFAIVSLAPSEAAHACKADIEGKWISAIL